MSSIVETTKHRTYEFGAFDCLLRRTLFNRLRGLRHGRLVFQDACGTVELGEPVTAHPDLQIQVQIVDPEFYRAIAANGSVGAAEALMNGHWRCDDLVALVRLLVRNRDLLDGMESGLSWLGSMGMRLWSALRRNTRIGSRRNIAAHYDLGNDFFKLFLSADLMYSSAIWAKPEDTLEIASARKLEVICRKLDLKRGDRLIEIGSGWGGFALYAAQHFGCHVTTTTISREQFELAQARVSAAGLGTRVQVLLKDYRDLRGQFDKLASIEMIEAIGAPYMETFFRQVGSLLKPGGTALVQAITIEDHRYLQALKSTDFIKRHVFPGSFIPSVNALLNAKTRADDLNLIHLEDFGDSYALTLETWRKRFLAHLPQVRAQGFDERFIRMWEYYLAYCEGGFRERSIGVAHLLLAKPGRIHRAFVSESASDSCVPA
jgi:cyclopropane-fatty-acyl-phospholipid synthase